MKTRILYAAALIGTVVSFSLTPTPIRAAEGEDQWQFGVTVPLWAPQIEGDATVRGRTADVDISFDELKDHLDASFSLGLEARKGKLGFYTGVGYMKFSADGSLPGGASGDAELKFLIVDAGMSYRLVQPAGERPFILEAIAGIRYWGTKTDLEITGPGGAVLLDDDAKQDLVDPIIGLRGSQFLTGKLHLDFAADIGGFGISDNQSDLDWSATGLVSYDIAKWFSLSAGYKALSLDASEGSGTSKKGVDVVMHGLLIAAKFKF